jgi:hypothetical protein
MRENASTREKLTAGHHAASARSFWGVLRAGVSRRRQGAARLERWVGWAFIKCVDPLHVGRKCRTATPKMSKALAERDRR